MTSGQRRLPAPLRRRQLLDVALEVFAERGFHDTAMDEVAEAAGVTKPVLYQHFPSKRSMFLELLHDVGTSLVEELQTSAATATSPRRQVEAGFAAYFRFVRDRASAFRLLFGEGPRRDEDFARAVDLVETAVADVVASLIAADIDEDHRRVLAYGIVGLAEGVGRHAVASDLPLDPDVLARQVAELAWAGLRGVSRVSEGPGPAP